MLRKSSIKPEREKGYFSPSSEKGSTPHTPYESFTETPVTPVHDYHLPLLHEANMKKRKISRAGKSFSFACGNACVDLTNCLGIVNKKWSIKHEHNQV